MYFYDYYSENDFELFKDSKKSKKKSKKKKKFFKKAKKFLKNLGNKVINTVLSTFSQITIHFFDKKLGIA